MSYYKRKRGGQGTEQKPPEGSAARESVRILDRKDFNLRREMDYIVKAASRGEARIMIHPQFVDGSEVESGAHEESRRRTRGVDGRRVGG